MNDQERKTIKRLKTAYEYDQKSAAFAEALNDVFDLLIQKPRPEAIHPGTPFRKHDEKPMSGMNYGR